MFAQISTYISYLFIPLITVFTLLVIITGGFISAKNYLNSCLKNVRKIRVPKDKKEVIIKSLSMFIVLCIIFIGLVCGQRIIADFLLKAPGPYGEAMASVLPDKKIIRLAGNSCENTAIAIAKQSWPKGTDVVVLVRDDNFTDNLAAAPLAKKYNAPILFTDGSTLTVETDKYVAQLKTKKVFLLGSEDVISGEIAKQLSAEGREVTRLSGKDRYEMAATIARTIGQKGQAVIVNGDDFLDALAASSWAAYKGIPILLTAKNNLPSATKAVLSELEVNQTIVVGGNRVVSDEILAQLKSPQRYYGEDRYQTAVDVATRQGCDPKKVFLVTGENFSDALAGSVLAAQSNSALLFVDKLGLSSDVNSFLHKNHGKVEKIFALGGRAVLPFRTIYTAEKAAIE